MARQVMAMVLQAMEMVLQETAMAHRAMAMATALQVVARHRLPARLQGPFCLLFRGPITLAYMALVQSMQSPAQETACFMRTAKLDLSRSTKIRRSSLESVNRTSTAPGLAP